MAHAASTALPPFWKIMAPASAPSGLPVIATQCRPWSAGFWVRWAASIVGNSRNATNKQRWTAIGDSGRRSLGSYVTPMRVAIVPRTRWGRIRMIAIASFLPLLFLVIWLFTVKMPGPAFVGPLPPLTPNQEEIRAQLQRHVTALAHDNASGVAGVLELARVFAGNSQRRTVRFVFFPNEEPPWFPTSNMGSRHYAAAACARNDQIVAMLSIESIGYFETEKGSQRYPFPLNLAYPDVGDFIGFVSNLRSRGLLRQAIATFRAHATLPTQGAAAPAW